MLYMPTAIEDFRRDRFSLLEIALVVAKVLLALEDEKEKDTFVHFMLF